MTNKHSFFSTSIILLVLNILTLFNSACNRNEEPPTTIDYYFCEQYIPMTIEYSKTDTDLIEQIRPVAGKQFVINSLDELNANPMGFSEAYKKINFNDYTLLVYYLLHRYNIEAYSSRYYKNTLEGNFNWVINLSTTDRPELPDDKGMMTRFALLVRKLPSDAEVKTWTSISSLDWSWD